MKALLEEMRNRPGDWVFLPIFFYAMLTMSWQWVLAAFLIGWGVNVTFGPGPKK